MFVRTLCWFLNKIGSSGKKNNFWKIITWEQKCTFWCDFWKGGSFVFDVTNEGAVIANEEFQLEEINTDYGYLQHDGAMSLKICQYIV